MITPPPQKKILRGRNRARGKAKSAFSAFASIAFMVLIICECFAIADGAKLASAGQLFSNSKAIVESGSENSIHTIKSAGALGLADSGFYAISFNGNGATGGSMSNVLATKGVDSTLPVNDFVKKGYSFTGWDTSVAPISCLYVPTTSWTNTTADNYFSYFKIQVWEGERYIAGVIDCLNLGLSVGEYTPSASGYYTFRYGANGNKQDYCDTKTIALKAGKTYQVSVWLSGFSNDSCTMLWLAVAEKGTSSDSYVNGGTINKNVSGTIVLTARWTVTSYTVAYNGNGATSGSTTSSSHKYNIKKALTANGFIRDGYDFIGWNTAADGSGTAYTNQEAVANLTTTHGATVMLYAQWSLKSYNQTIYVRYQNADSSWGSYGTMLNETRDHFSTVSWSRSQDSTYQSAAVSYEVTGATVKFVDVARKKATAIIRYRLQNADGSYPTEYTVGTTDTKCVGGSLRYTYGQTALHQTKTGTVTIDAAASDVASPKDVTVSLDIPRNVWTVSYEPNGGTGSITSQQMLAGNSITLPSTGMTREGYRLSGWTIGSATGEFLDPDTGFTPDGSVSLYAKWNRVHSVTYHDGWYETDETRTDQADDAEDGSDYTIEDNQFDIRQGFTFVNWNSAPDGSGTAFEAGAGVPITDDIDLYAQWNLDTASVVNTGMDLPRAIDDVAIWLALSLVATAMVALHMRRR